MSDNSRSHEVLMGSLELIGNCVHKSHENIEVALNADIINILTKKFIALNNYLKNSNSRGEDYDTKCIQILLIIVKCLNNVVQGHEGAKAQFTETSCI